MTREAAFWELHSGMEREGPGEHADVIWAVAQAGVPEAAHICDAGSGPGGDIAALLTAVPRSRVTAVDTHLDFVTEVRTRFAGDDRVDAIHGTLAPDAKGGMARHGPYEFIWSAGAVYFVGIPAALTSWRQRLASGGSAAFSQPCFFDGDPSQGARDLWGGDAVQTEAEIEADITAAGWQTVATRRLADGAWETYYAAMQTRIDALSQRDDPDMQSVLEETRREISGWRAHRHETGYLLCVVRPS